MDSPLDFAFGLLSGVALGGVAASLWFRPRLAALRVAAGEASRAVAEACSVRARLTAMQAMLSMLRHDLHGILSPALLTADRLANSEDPAIKRAGDVIIRTVERATARLAATREEEAVLTTESGGAASVLGG